MDNHIAVIETEIQPVLSQAREIVISKDEDLVAATELLTQLNTVIDRVEAEKAKVLRPLLDAAAAERARWKPLEQAYKEVIEPLRQKMSVYETERQARLAKEAQLAADAVAAGKLSLDDAANAITATSQPRKFETPTGSLAFRDKAQVKIVNAAKIPRAYLVPDEATILAALEEGKKVAGCELEIIKVPVNRR